MRSKVWWGVAALVLGSGGAWAQHDMNAHAAHMAHDRPATSGAAMATAPDTRALVAYPQPLVEHTLTSMRDHLVSLQRIQAALGRGDWDEAANLAENRLGMGSLQEHGAHEVAQYMPARMAEIGTTMHRSASQFAVVARDASVSGELRPVLAALAHVTAQCVACHAAYRLR